MTLASKQEQVAYLHRVFQPSAGWAALGHARTPAPRRGEQRAASVPRPAGVGWLHARGTIPPTVSRKDASEARHLLSSAGTILSIFIQHLQRLPPPRQAAAEMWGRQRAEGGEPCPWELLPAAGSAQPQQAVEKAQPSFASTRAGTTSFSP